MSATPIQKPATLTKLELTSVHALLAYAAYNQSVSEEVIRATVLKRFGVSDVAQLPASAFDDVIKFLVDIQAQMLLN